MAGADPKLTTSDGSSISMKSPSCLLLCAARLTKGFEFSSLKISARAGRLTRERFGFESGPGNQLVSAVPESMISPKSVPLLVRFPRIEGAMSKSLCCPVNDVGDVELDGGGW